MRAKGANVVLQAKNHLLRKGELTSEGEISRSSVCCEFGGGCISHAGAARMGGHCGAGGVDEQPLIAAINSALQILVVLLGTVQLLGMFVVERGGDRQALAGDTGGFAQALGLELDLVALRSGLVALLQEPVEGEPGRPGDKHQDQQRYQAAHSAASSRRRAWSPGTKTLRPLASVT